MLGPACHVVVLLYISIVLIMGIYCAKVLNMGIILEFRVATVTINL